MTFYEIIIATLAALLVPLIVVYFSNKWNDTRDRMKRFNDSADEFRKVCNQIIVAIQDGTFCSFGIIADKEIIKLHSTAYLNFRHHLKGETQKQYDHVWEKYCFDLERIGQILLTKRSNRFDIEKDIKELLYFTEYRMFSNIKFTIKKYHNRLFPPSLSKEIQKAVKEILGQNKKLN